MNPLVAVRDTLDRQLGRVTMYRLVTITLALLAAVYAVFTATGVIEGLSTGDNLVALAVLLVASVVSNRLLGLAWRITPHTESAVITALLLFFIFVPLIENSVANLSWLAASAVLANASKFVLAWRGRHVLNPAAAGALLVVVVQDLAGRDLVVSPLWQTAASESLLPFLAVASVLVLWRTRRLDVGLTFAIVAYVLTIVGLTNGFESGTGDALTGVLYSYPILFMAAYMVTEPLTLPPRRAQQLAVAVATAVVFAYGSLVVLWDGTPITVQGRSFTYELTPEVAILVGNLVAFAFARRRGLSFELEGTRQLSPETHELTFRSKRDVSFTPGQYVELTLPHRGMDGRGARRTFSVSSPPDADGRFSFALRVPEKSSSFKRALLALEPGEKVQGTGVGGDFVWPSDPSIPLLLVAGGIGITPFLSQLRHEGSRDAVLVYGASSPDEVPFTEELAGVRVVLVCPERPSHLPEGWTYVAAPFVSVDLIADSVPDLGDRKAYVSGPPAMVNAVRGDLRKRCASVKTDYFTGY